MSAGDPVASFEPHRRRLTGLAYRMLGSLAEAEDAVQDAYLRWHQADRGQVANPHGFLSKTVARLCLDRLKSARARRESYVGPWLPEPVLDTAALSVEAAHELAEDVSVALMLTLERLSPLERAAFLMHDVFDMAFTEVAEVLGRDEAACRQLAARGRAHVRAERPRFRASPEQCTRLAAAFGAAIASGDTAALAELLAADAVLHSDGGGRAKAALRPILGSDRIARFLIAIARKAEEAGRVTVRPATINGLAGFLITSAEGAVQTMAVEVEAERIRAVYIVTNPDKLRAITRGSPPGAATTN